MTENENVASTEEAQNEPVPNPYNARKSWHTDDVMPKEGLSAESLHDSGWTYAVTYDDDTTTPKGIHYEMLVAPLIKIVKDLNTRLAALEG